MMKRFDKRLQRVASIVALVLCLALAACMAGNVKLAFADDASTGDAVSSHDDSVQVDTQPVSTLSLDDERNSVKEDQLPDSSFIYDTSIADLAEADSYYDNQTVVITGEAVGDVVNESLDSDYCWVVLWDKDKTVTVYMQKSEAKLIDTLGSYSRVGTTLKVRGVFNLTCADHNGISDLHAESVSVATRGSAKPDTVKIDDFIPGICLVVAGLLLLYLFHRLRESER